MDAIPSDESISPQEEPSVNSYNRQESLLTDCEDFLFDKEIMEDVAKRPRNGPNYQPFSYKKNKKKGGEATQSKIGDDETVSIDDPRK